MSECTSLFIIPLNFKNKLVCIVMSSMFSPFYLQVLKVLNWKFLECFVIYRIGYFGLVFYMAFKACKNFCTYIFSKESSTFELGHGLQMIQDFLKIKIILILRTNNKAAGIRHSGHKSVHSVHIYL